MQREALEAHLDLRQADIDPEAFAAALAVRHIRSLIAHGGSEFGWPDEDALHPDHLEAFLARAVETAHKTKRFEREWSRLRQLVPLIKAAWERGHVLFQEALTRATNDEEDMEYLSQIDFAVDCYACVSALNIYPHDQVQQAWAINGYMLAWQRHFLTDDE